MTRRRRTTKQRLAIFEAHGGVCHICGGKIDGTREAWDLEHIIPLALGGEDEGDNLAPAHAACHREKTATDAGQIAKANRVRAGHSGAKAESRSPLPGGRRSKWKKKISGQVVPR